MDDYALTNVGGGRFLHRSDVSDLRELQSLPSIPEPRAVFSVGGAF